MSYEPDGSPRAHFTLSSRLSLLRVALDPRDTTGLIVSLGWLPLQQRATTRHSGNKRVGSLQILATTIVSSRLPLNRCGDCHG